MSSALDLLSKPIFRGGYFEEKGGGTQIMTVYVVMIIYYFHLAGYSNT